ncbi:MAG: aldo/keto reductase [Opitutus sp.]
MEYRKLGNSDLTVPVLSLGTGTFGGRGELFKSWGSTDVSEATRLVDIAIEAGVNMFDSADVYSEGAAEEILGGAMKGRRDRVIISTKGGLPTGDGPNDLGSSRSYLSRAIENSLRRLGTDYIDIYQLHAFDGRTPIDETLDTLDGFVRAGKLRYIGASNFSGWQLMKSIAISKERRSARYVVHQVYYSLVGRDYEWELMPLGLDQSVSAMVWSPLGWGRLTGKLRRGQPLPSESRLKSQVSKDVGPPVNEGYLFDVVDVLDAIALETGKTVAQVALNWVLGRPTVANVIVGARNEEQLQQNLGAVGWALTAEQIARLDAVSATTKPYPYYPYSQPGGFARLNPPPV